MEIETKKNKEISRRFPSHSWWAFHSHHTISACTFIFWPQRYLFGGCRGETPCDFVLEIWKEPCQARPVETGRPRTGQSHKINLGLPSQEL